MFMRIDYNVEKLKQALSCFYEATGVNIQFFTDDFTPLRLNPQKHNHYCKSVQSCEAGKPLAVFRILRFWKKQNKANGRNFTYATRGLWTSLSPFYMTIPFWDISF